MTLSPFFHDLRAAYQAELDDLRFDSEGGDVLRRRLADKRKEIGFLVSMMEVSPEMVAVVFHQGLRFRLPAVMDELLSREADEFPEWSSLADCIDMEPWAVQLAQTVLKEPGGEWFMTVAAGLEYLAGRTQVASLMPAQGDEDDDDDDESGDDQEQPFHGSDDAYDSDSDSEADAKARREAGDDWMVEQGFDRKD